MDIWMPRWMVMWWVNKGPQRCSHLILGVSKCVAYMAK